MLRVVFAWPAAALLLAGCATVPLEQSGSLSSYEGLAQSDGLLTRARISVNKSNVLSAKTVQIVPTSFARAASEAGLSELQRGMIANAIDRSMCIGLSGRFNIVVGPAPADLSVHAMITHVILTDEKAAAASRLVSVGASVAEKFVMPVPVPIPIPRIPIGLGGLSVESEALDRNGGQEAAMIWARGADAVPASRRIELYGKAPNAEAKAELERDVAELDDLIEEILLASRLDIAGVPPAMEHVDLLALVAEECAH